MQTNSISTQIILAIMAVGVISVGIWWWFTPTDHLAHRSMDHAGHTMTVASEQEFIQAMIPHHTEAVEAARIVLSRGGTTPAVRELATAIIAAQTAEIVQLKAWHEDWYDTPAPDVPYMPMLRAVRTLSGVELDRAFLSDMIPHHEGAITMVESVRPFITHAEIATLADAIVATQAEEITLMRELLATLPLQ